MNDIRIRVLGVLEKAAVSTAVLADVEAIFSGDESIGRPPTLALPPQYDKPTYDDAAGYNGLHGYEGFAAYRATWPPGTMIYNPAGEALDVRGQPITGGTPGTPFDFGRGSSWPVNFKSIDDSPLALTFNVPTSGSYWMSPGYGAAEGDIGFQLADGSGLVIASGNAGIDEAAPVSLTSGVGYILTAILNKDSAAVQQRVAAGNPAASGLYILRAKT